MAEASIDSNHALAPDDAKRRHHQAKQRVIAQSARVDALAARLSDATARAEELGSKLGAVALEVLKVAETEIETVPAALEALGTHSERPIESMTSWPM